MINVANSWEDSELKEALILTIANHMKKCFLNWNKDTVDDYVIYNHLYELSDGIQTVITIIRRTIVLITKRITVEINLLRSFKHK